MFGFESMRWTEWGPRVELAPYSGHWYTVFRLKRRSKARTPSPADCGGAERACCSHRELPTLSVVLSSVVSMGGSRSPVTLTFLATGDREKGKKVKSWGRARLAGSLVV